MKGIGQDSRRATALGDDGLAPPRLQRRFTTNRHPFGCPRRWLTQSQIRLSDHLASYIHEGLPECHPFLSIISAIVMVIIGIIARIGLGSACVKMPSVLAAPAISSQISGLDFLPRIIRLIEICHLTERMRSGDKPHEVARTDALLP